jgi:hypothetical protein
MIYKAKGTVSSESHKKKKHKCNVISMQNFWMLNLVVCIVTSGLSMVNKMMDLKGDRFMNSKGGDWTDIITESAIIWPSNTFCILKPRTVFMYMGPGMMKV